MEEILIEWIRDCRQRHLRVTRKRIKQKAKYVLHDLVQQQQVEAGEFEASEGWLEKFMSRKGLSLRKRTTNFSETAS